MFIKLIIKLLSIFDYFQKKKIIKFFNSKNLSNLFNFFDVGSHHGETINLFNENFKIQNIYAFEPSKANYQILRNKTQNLKKNNIYLFNLAVGSKKQKLKFNQSLESQSSTFLNLNKDSKYLAKKKKLLLLKNNEYFKNTYIVDVIDLKSFIREKKIKMIDILKIDTEGFDFDVIMGIGEDLNIIKYIYFEHHYHDMFIKKHKFSEINRYLIDNNFRKVFKVKMMFRKTFEYIYSNNKI